MRVFSTSAVISGQISWGQDSWENSHGNSRFSTLMQTLASQLSSTYSHANFRFSTLMQTLASQLSSTLMQTFASQLSSTLMQTLASQLSCKLSLLNFHQRSCKLSLLNSQQISSKITNGISYICVAGIRGQQWLHNGEAQYPESSNWCKILENRS